ncbi:CaiB/BaiF CoA transferase family protein [Actinomadura rugatobispora]|uniref:CaiB/BaiF CoA transferase family protein n=1 Tax=Actinomadura rugatobispora TaxID=1994 RepID=A0ABW1AHK6_9ACTN|nr:CoA transferase [Actinomadura rugatobispora]
MTAVMQGVRVLEVAEHTFVPAASALLADWGAEVVKIEHVERGDAMRGLASTGTASVSSDVHVLFEHSNRGKRSLALDLASPEGLDILYALAAKSDIFVTNKLAGVRRKLKIDVEDIRAHNPRIIYVRGSGQGERGPDGDRGSYDMLGFWARAGIGAGVQGAEPGPVPSPPGPGFGDSIGAMAIAGGMMGALFHRERTGEGTVVDVSLLGTGLWSMGHALALSLQLGVPFTAPSASSLWANPLVGNYRTRDGRWLAFCCLQAGRYWASLCEAIGRPGAAADPRFADHHSIMANNEDAIELLREAFEERTVDEWRARLEGFTGPWSVVQNIAEAGADPQTAPNGYVQTCRTAAGVPFQVAAAPVQFDGEPAAPERAPEFNEHGDAILAGLGFGWDAITDLKLRGIVA